MAQVAKGISLIVAMSLASVFEVWAQSAVSGTRLQSDDEALAVCDAVIFVGGHNNGVSKPLWNRPLTFGKRFTRAYAEVHEVSLRIGKNAAPSRVFQITQDASSPMPKPWWIIPHDSQVLAFLAKLESAKVGARTSRAVDPLSEEGEAGSSAFSTLIEQSRHPGYTYEKVPTPRPILPPGTNDPLAPALYHAGNTEFFRGGSYLAEMITFRDRGYIQAIGSGRDVVFRFQSDGELEALCWRPTTASEFYTITPSD